MRVHCVVESTPDGPCPPVVFPGGPAGRFKAVAYWRKLVLANLGRRRFGGETLTAEEMQQELEQAIENAYDWAGWDCKVQLWTCTIRGLPKAVPFVKG